MSVLRDLVWKSFHLFTTQSFCQFLKSPSHLPPALEELIEIASKLKLSDLGLCSRSINSMAERGYDPVFYMSVVDGDSDAMTENARQSVVCQQSDPANLMTVAVFFLKPNAKLPLHNHPKMLGILKVLHGSLIVQCYSSVVSLTPGEDSVSRILARKSPRKVLNSNSDPVFLYKNQDDIHEIWNNSDQMAAFLDVLAPPYDCRRADEFGLKCTRRSITYYQEKMPGSKEMLIGEGLEAKNEYFVLEEIPCPDYYTCEHIEYTGSSLAKPE